jgi:hypothetical protein
MRPFSSGYRWLQRRPLLTQPWRQNPWISSSSNTPQPRDGDDVAEKKQQKEALGIWEDEGGSIRSDGSVRR